MSDEVKSTEFRLPAEEKQMRQFMAENHAHRLLKTEEGVMVLIGSDIPKDEDQE